MKVTNLLPSLLIGSSFVVATPIQNADSCAPVHLIVARGSDEPQGEGLIGALAKKVKSNIPGATDEALVYPASNVSPLDKYIESMGNGTVALKEAITHYATNCPKSKLVLLGYSQVSSLVSYFAFDVIGRRSANLDLLAFDREQPLWAIHSVVVEAGS
jgi:Cutinase